MSLLTDCSDTNFANIVANSFSLRECEEKLGYNSYSGSVSRKIKQRIEELNLDMSHFNVLQKHDWTKENPFIKDSKISQKTLRKYYKQGNFTVYQCSICGQRPIWNGKELTLILDHINGNNRDDRLENLRWVCPNCNQQLETTGSKNIVYQQKTPKI